jgi:predicted component of type VI protein secretion system
MEWVEEISHLKLPAGADERLRVLMDRNTEGKLSTDERLVLESLVELSERLSLVRADALALLGRKPS